MSDEQKTGFEQYWGVPKDVSAWSTKAIAELVSLGYEMSDQGEPMYEAYALGMVAIIAELRAVNEKLTELLSESNLHRYGSAANDIPQKENEHQHKKA